MQNTIINFRNKIVVGMMVSPLNC